MPLILPNVPSGLAGAFTSARGGMAQASAALGRSADRVAAGTDVAMGVIGSPETYVELSPEALDLLNGIEDALIESKLAQHSYTANATVFRAADELSAVLANLASREA